MTLLGTDISLNIGIWLYMILAASACLTVRDAF